MRAGDAARRPGRGGAGAAVELACLLYAAGMLWLGLLAIGPALLTPMRAVVVLSGSMQPTVRAGDVVLFAPAAGRDLLPGQVILFPDPSRPQRLLTHRVEEVLSGGSYRTRGDANDAADSTPVRGEDVAGVARLLVPLAGLPALWARTGQLAPLTVWAAATVGLASGAGLTRSARRSQRPGAKGAIWSLPVGADPAPPDGSP